MKKKLLIVGLVVVVLASGVGIFVFARNDTNSPTNQENTQPTPQKEEDQEPEQPVESPLEPTLPESSNYDISSPSSLTAIINKNRPLPADYVPNDLVVPAVRLRLDSSQEQMKFRNAASSQLKEMFDAAAADGVSLVFGSGYRSYALQKQFYESYVARDGQEAADRYSARPGTSEHQAGLSFDATSPDQTCHLEICFENTSQGQWLAANAHKHGFHLRYRKGKESVTGYQYEPWHFRYLGKDLAGELHEKNLTLEEYFKL